MFDKLDKKIRKKVKNKKKNIVVCIKNAGRKI